MKRIALLFLPIILLMLVLTGVINVHTLKRNLKNAAVNSVHYVRETSDRVANAMARRFPSLFGDRY